jgi:hypothetical protein
MEGLCRPQQEIGHHVITGSKFARADLTLMDSSKAFLLMKPRSSWSKRVYITICGYYLLNEPEKDES